MTQIPIDKDLLALAKFLGVIPPDEWKLECWTQDQREHWAKIHYDYQLIFQHFGSSIQGVQSPLDEMNLKKPYREYIRSRTRAYKALFDALWEGWSEVNRALQKVDPIEANVDRMPQSPGEAVFAIVLQDARIAFSRCLKPYSELSSSRLKTSVEGNWQVERLRSLPPSRESQKKIEDLLRRNRIVRHKAGLDSCKYLRDWVLPVLEKKFRGDRSEHPMKAYRRHESDLGKIAKRLNHPQNKLGMETWKKGIREATGRETECYKT